MKKSLILITLLASTQFAYATDKTTKCMDKDGNLLITDEPCSSAPKPGMSVIEIEQRRMSNTPPPAGAPAAPPPLPPTPAKSAAEPVRKPNQPAN